MIKYVLLKTVRTTNHINHIHTFAMKYVLWSASSCHVHTEKLSYTALTIQQLLRNHVQTYHNIAPLIKLDRKIPVWLHPLCIGRIHDCKKKAALGLRTIQPVYAKPFFLLHISLIVSALRTMLLCLILFKTCFLSKHIIFSLKRVLSLHPVSLQNRLLAAGQSTIQSLLSNDTMFESLA